MQSDDDLKAQGGDYPKAQGGDYLKAQSDNRLRVQSGNYLKAESSDDLKDRMILVDKPSGISSFGVVAKVRGKMRKELGQKVKVGHTGTLDPFATGLLIILTGKMTKKSADFLKLDKEYVATMKLGYVSTTGDPEGEIRSYSTQGASLVSGAVQSAHGSSSVPGVVQSTHDFSSAPGAVQPAHDPSSAPGATQSVHDSLSCQDLPSLKMIETVTKSFVGKIKQVPPKYSAIKIDGERAYKLARKGEDFEMPSREVEIYEIEILRYEWPELEIRCAVSSGTYIRTLAEDIGEKLRLGAYLTALRRTKVGKYSVDEAIKLDDFCK